MKNPGRQQVAYVPAVSLWHRRPNGIPGYISESTASMSKKWSISTQHWWEHTWSTVSSSGFPSTIETWTYWVLVGLQEISFKHKKTLFSWWGWSNTRMSCSECVQILSWAQPYSTCSSWLLCPRGGWTRQFWEIPYKLNDSIILWLIYLQ